jgi:uncharacterized protein YciW
MSFPIRPATDPLHAAIGELARKVAASPAGITEADLKPLRDLGLSDVDILLSDDLR